MLCFASVAIYYNSAHRSRRHWLLSWYKMSKLFTFRLKWNNVRASVSLCVCIFVRFDETMNIGRTNNFCLYKHIRTMSQMRKRQKRKETIESIPHSRTFPNQSILTRFYSTMKTINFFNHVSWQFFAFVFSPYFNG